MNSSADYVTRIFEHWSALDPAAWNELLYQQSEPTPFMRWEYLNAMQISQSATQGTGWDVRIVTLWSGDGPNAQLVAACPLYLKQHSYGEYVFDFAWAQAYEAHGLQYYPKAVIASPFTPVPGTRLLAQDSDAQAALLRVCQTWCDDNRISSLHLLFTAKADQAACAAMLPRDTVQFHWTNQSEKPFADFDEFLMTLTHDKRKKIKQERRKVLDPVLGAGIRFRSAVGRQISPEDWDFFYRCYEQTYIEHANAPYLTRDFFTAWRKRCRKTGCYLSQRNKILQLVSPISESRPA